MDRVAIVTGASRGIGRATAIRLARDFHAVALVARTQETLAGTADAVRVGGSRNRSSSLGICASQTRPEPSSLRCTTPLAGSTPLPASLVPSPRPTCSRSRTNSGTTGLALKFHSARRLTIAAWNALKSSGGSVAITSGTSAYTPKASLAAVGTINAAILALAKAFADRGVKDGVQVNTILPGSVMTDRRRTMLQGYADTHGLPLETAIDRFAAEVGIARYGQPEDIANAFAFLFAPGSHWITGTALRVDGGETKVL